MKLRSHFCVAWVPLLVILSCNTVGAKVSLQTKLEKTFPAIAKEENTTVPALLNKTIFEIIGHNPEYVLQNLPNNYFTATPSTPLIRLLNFTTVSELQASYPIISRYPTLPNNYNYSIKMYIVASVMLDQSNTTSHLMNTFYSLNISLESYLNMSASDLQKKPYLTGVYQALKKLTLMMLKGSDSAFFAKGLKFNLSRKDRRQFFENSTYDEIEALRSKMISAAIEQDQVMYAAYYLMTSQKVAINTRKRLTQLREIASRSLNSSFSQCGFNNSMISSLTFDALTRKCMNLDMDFPLSKMFFSHRMLKVDFGEAGQFLKKTLQELAQYNITQITRKVMEEFSKRSITATVSPLIVVASFQKISLNELTEMKLKSIMPKLMNMTDNMYYMFDNTTHMYMNITIKQLATEKGISVNALVTAMLPDLHKALSPYNKTLMKTAVTTGLSYIVFRLPLKQIEKLYEMKRSFLDSMTIVRLANYIADVNGQDVAKVFFLDSVKMAILLKASIADASVLLRLIGLSLPVHDFIPSRLVSYLGLVSGGLTRLVDTLNVVASQKGLQLANLTPEIIQSYGPWGSSDVNKLLNIIGFQALHFNALKKINVSALSQLVKIPLPKLGNISIIQFLKLIKKPVTNPMLFIHVMQMTFPQRAAALKISLTDLLKMTWFQIVGATSHQLTLLGLTKMLPLTPSNELIQFMNTTSILEQAKSYAPIVNVPTLLNKNYSYSILLYFHTALYLDTANVTATVLKAFPIGNSSLAYLFNTTDAGVKGLRYLTGVYPKFKKYLPEILNKTAATYYETLPLQKLSFRFFKELMSSDGFRYIDGLRMKYAVSVIDLNNPAAVKNAIDLGHTMVIVTIHRYSIVSNAFFKPLNDSYNTCRVAPTTLGSLTMMNVLQKCINVSNDFPMPMLFPMAKARLMNGLPIGVMAAFLNKSPAEFAKYSMFSVLSDLSADSMKNSKFPIAFKAFRSNIKYTELASMTLTQFAIKAHLIPDSSYINNQSTRQRLETMTFGKLLPVINSRMNSNLTLNGLYTLPYPYMIKIFIHDTKGILKAALSKGLAHLSYNVTIDTIRKIYDISPAYLSKQTLFTLANHVSSISEKDFVNLFEITPSHMSLMSAARISDLRTLYKMAGSVIDIDFFAPVPVANYLFGLPASLTMLLKKVDDISKGTKIKIQNLAIAGFLKTGSWHKKQVDLLLKILDVPRSYYDEMKQMKLSMLSRIINTPLNDIGKFNILDVVNALCRTGQRFNGTTCVAFSGCSAASASICIANAECIDIIGSYMCRCKTGYAGDGNTCYDACKTTQCPSDSTCSNVPDKGPVCKCNKPLTVMKNNKCIKVKSKLFKVTGTKFNQVYDEKYKDKSSKEFKAKAAEMSNVLNVVICPKLFGCLDIVVVDINKGSIIVDYNVVVDVNAQNVTASTVQSASVQALKDPNLKVLKPVQSSQPSAQASDICQSGHDCGQHSKCVVIADGNYRCECNEGYELNGGSCTETDNKAVKIAVPIVVIGVIILLVLFVFLFHRHKTNSKNLENNPYKLEPKTTPVELDKAVKIAVPIAVIGVILLLALFMFLFHRHKKHFKILDNTHHELESEKTPIELGARNEIYESKE